MDLENDLNLKHTRTKSFDGNCMSEESAIDSAGNEQKIDALQQEENLSENKRDCVIDVKCDGGIGDVKNTSCTEDEETICRVCHMSSNCSAHTDDLIQLGCGCRNDLGTAHRNCAERWFAMKGNKFCEICGIVARNISGVGDNGFTLQWNNERLSSYYSASREHNSQPFCAFIIPILVMAFVLYWFLHEKSRKP